MIDTKNIGIRISELAIRGELSHRVDSSLSIDDIIANIRVEREDLIRKKATKIAKVSEMLSDEIFDIPTSWKWVALGDVCIFLSRGKSPKYSEEKKYPVFAQKCNQPNSLALEKARFLDVKTIEKWPDYFRLRESDVVINSTGTGTVGRVGYYTTDTLGSEYEFMLPDSHVTVVRTGKQVLPRYIYYVLRTATIQNIMEKTFRGSTNQKEFYIDSVYSIPIPLPPTEEQKEIVELLDDVFELLRTIDDLQFQYNNDLEVLKRKIIDAGIQGKLTDQLPEDGDAETLYERIQEEKAKLIKGGKIKKEKPLPEIDEDEIPFEIPKNWKWVRLKEVGYLTSGGQYKEDDHGIPYVKVGDMNLDENKKEIVTSRRFTSRDNVGIIPRGSIIFPKRGGAIATNKKRIVRTTDIFVDSNTMGFTVYDIKIFDFIMLWFYSIDLAELQTGTTIPQINNKDLYPCLIPLPPLEEQKRIVEKIDTILKQIIV